jgi:Na+-transporting methylmalonyl-CoA/oxaloacetate decarboxylase gamma subunit
MSIFRQYIAPFLIVLVFLVALLAVSARIFLPSDMAAPAPIEEVQPKADASNQTAQAAIAQHVTQVVQLRLI